MPSRSVSDRPSRSTDHVELFRVHRLHHSVKRRTLNPALGAADPSLLVNFDDLPARAISYGFQFSALIFSVLLGRADANVECNALHDDLPAEITSAIDQMEMKRLTLISQGLFGSITQGFLV
jgi:hypothetical protein